MLRVMSNKVEIRVGCGNHKETLSGVGTVTVY